MESLELTTQFGKVIVIKDETGISFNIPESLKIKSLNKIKEKFSEEIKKFKKGIKKEVKKEVKKVKKSEFKEVLFFTNLRNKEIKEAKLKIRALKSSNFVNTNISLKERKEIIYKIGFKILDKYGVDLLKEFKSNNGFDNTGIKIENYLKN